MNFSRIWATARRILSQLRHDPRTIALMVIAPIFLMTILKYVYNDQPQVFQRVAGSLLGVFPMLVMFLITSVATLRERTSGTLERLLILPITKLEFILGYAMAFGIAAFIQAVLVTSAALGPLGLKIAGSQLTLIWVAILDALLGMALGLFVSSFAKTEFQAVQFMPAILLPQLLLSGLLAPRAGMPRLLEIISNFLPLTYAVDATRKVLSGSKGFTTDFSLITLFLLALLAMGAVSLKRKSK
ncbi:MAG: ABC transporter permease [Actinobacteria bacterium]|nr:ABC transporter permease [Actinomycetota bacterium]